MTYQFYLGIAAGIAATFLFGWIVAIYHSKDLDKTVSRFQGHMRDRDYNKFKDKTDDTSGRKR